MSALPPAWTSAKLGDVIQGFETGRNIQASGSPARDGEIGVLKISAVTWGRFQPNLNKALLPGDSPLKHETVRAGDLLISRANTTELVGAPVLVEKSYPNLMLPDKILRVLYNSAIVDARYLLYALRTRSARTHLEAEATGTSDSMRNLSQPKLRETPIALAPLPEQKRIADKLDMLLARLNACRDRLDQVPTILKRFRLVVLEAATTGSLTADWSTEQKEPWRNVTLNEMATDFSYGSAAKSSPTGSVPVLRMGNIQDGALDWTDLVFTSDQAEIEKYALREGDVLFNRTNSPELVGKTAVYRGEREAVYAGYLIRVRCSKDLLPGFLNYCLGSPSGRDYCWRVKSDGVSQSNINAKKLAAFPFEVPGFEEQTEIVRRVERLFDLADTFEARLATARALADRLIPALLQKAFCGELVPQDPNDEPATRSIERIASATQTPVPARKSEASSRRTDLKPAPKRSLSDIIHKMPKSDFTFDDLRQVATGNYESLKDDLFALLADKDSGVEQFFDANAKSIKIRRTGE